MTEPSEPVCRPSPLKGIRVLGNSHSNPRHGPLDRTDTGRSRCGLVKVRRPGQGRRYPAPGVPALREPGTDGTDLSGGVFHACNRGTRHRSMRSPFETRKEGQEGSPVGFAANADILVREFQGRRD